ncbi:unnamed protein product [Withania somnifera]
MTTQPIFVFMLLAILAFAMVAESSLSSHFDDPAVSALVRGFDDLTADRMGDRRALCDQKRITQTVIVNNAVPCDLRGASYYHCIDMQQIQPYKRGCTKITECKSH